MILVTGASGQTGRSVVDVLAGTGEHVRAFDIAPRLKELGDDDRIDVMMGDMSDPASVSEAMEGVRTVVHIGPVLHPQEADLGHNVVSAARRARVEHFVFFSVMHPQLEALPNHAAKLEIERHLLMSRLPYTVLQPTYYMQNVNVELALASGVLRQPFDLDSKVTLVDVDNVATITAQVVTKGASHFFATYQLCGADRRSTRELTQILSDESGRPVRPEPSTVAVGRESGPGSTEDEDFRADTLVRLIDHYERYGLNGNANVLTWLLGRRPTTFAEYVRRCLAEPGSPHAA